MSTPSAASQSSGSAAPRRQLTLWDSTSIIVGIIIGAGIYESSPLIASCVPSPAWLIGAWLLGGVISLIGALCYTELATTYPQSGGDYVYLTRAFGRGTGFLFAWAQLWVIRPGSIGAMAFVFARYANRLWPISSQTDEPLALMIYACGATAILSIINILGVQQGKWTQNLLTGVKVLGLVAIVGVGLWFSAPTSAASAPKPAASNFEFAMILILFTYGGWSEMAFVAAEIRNPEKNILRALVLGTVAVTAIYVMVNLAFLSALGFEGFRGSKAVAADVLQNAVGDWASRVISLLICLSALGACNGNIFTGSRIFYAMGTDHRLYAFLGRWSDRFGTPVWSLVVQAAITVALIVGFGQTEGGFSRMVNFTNVAFWTFLMLVGVSVFVLRAREPNTPRSYRVPGYPVTPVLFCLSSLFMLYSSLSYAISNRSNEAYWAIGLLLIGLGLSFHAARRPK
jgi:basic amino acid/polyamine antiporter, APA family